MEVLNLILFFFLVHQLIGSNENCLEGEIFCELLNGESACLPLEKLCDGNQDCIAFDDEQSADCNFCEGENLLRCVNWQGDICRNRQDGWEVCTGEENCWYNGAVKGPCCFKDCDGSPQCNSNNDFSDESIDRCPQCDSQPGTILCADNKTCMLVESLCQGWNSCPDGSDGWNCTCIDGEQFSC